MAIISILSIVIFKSVQDAHLAARISSARGELKSIHTAIVQLANDTEKWPFGCTIGLAADIEEYLSETQSGLHNAPIPGTIDTCTWTAGDIGNWNGPYLLDIEPDPWGNNYLLDTDYHPYENCPSTPSLQTRPVILSFGPNGAGINAYDCDDIFISLPSI
jgi:type II secretory pathway pseudopilin PulG